MLGFKRFDTASITISGIELAEKIKKAQFKTGKLAGRSATSPAIWAAILADYIARNDFQLARLQAREICTRALISDSNAIASS